MDYINVDILLGVSLAIVAFLYVYLEWKYGYWKRRDVPHLQATSLIFGNIKPFFFSKGDRKSIYQFIYNSAKGKPFVGYYEFQNPVLMIKDLDLAKSVLSQNFNSFRDQRFSISPKSDPLMAMNPFSRTYHNKWGESRAVLTPGLTQGKLRSYPQVFLKPYRDLSKFIDDSDGDLDLMDLAKRVTCDVVASWGWGVEGNACSKVQSPIFDTFKDMIIESYGLDLMVSNKFLARIKGSCMFSKRQSDFFMDLTRKCLARSNENSAGPPCLLQILVQSLSKTNQLDTSTEENLIKEVTAGLCTFFLDGFSTTSAILCFFLYELMLNRDIQTKLRDEIKALDNNLTLENVDRLEYLDMVLAEILRIRAPFHYLGRTCTKTCTLGSVELHPGNDVIIPITSINMDPDYYPNPEQFNPENFRAENKKKRHPFASLPFGFGPRMCLGLNFARIFLKIIVSSLINDYEIVAPTSHQYGPVDWDSSKAFIQFSEQNLYIKVIKLQN